MYCSVCGAEISENQNFCKYCGTSAKGQTVRMIRLICSDCQGVMDVDFDKNIRNCPYCSSKKLLVKGDKIRLIKLKAPANIKLDKMNPYSLAERKRIQQELIIERERRFGNDEPTINKNKHKKMDPFIKQMIEILVWIIALLAFNRLITLFL